MLDRLTTLPTSADTPPGLSAPGGIDPTGDRGDVSANFTANVSISPPAPPGLRAATEAIGMNEYAEARYASRAAALQVIVSGAPCDCVSSATDVASPRMPEKEQQVDRESR